MSYFCVSTRSWQPISVTANYYLVPVSLRSLCMFGARLVKGASCEQPNDLIWCLNKWHGKCFSSFFLLLSTSQKCLMDRLAAHVDAANHHLQTSTGPKQ